MKDTSREIPVFFPRLKSTSRAFAAPWNYIQGPGEFDHIAQYAKPFSENAYALIDGALYEPLKERLEKQFYEQGMMIETDKFRGECCQSEIDRVIGRLKENGAALAIAVGGGKTLDTVKAAAVHLDRHLFIVPTAASNDAPVSCLAIVYTEEGEHDHGILFHRGSDMVIVDSEIVIRAPRRLLAAGMGDALSTYYEALAVERTQSKNCIGRGYLACQAGMAIAKCCNDILYRDGRMALLSQEKGVISEAFENVLEANVLLSGLGFENTNCSICHSVNAGFTVLSEANACLHGERVAFGVLVQLIFENAPAEELKKVLDFLYMAKLPMTLGQCGVQNSDEKISAMAEKMVYGHGSAQTQARVVTEDTVFAAIKLADHVGSEYLQEKEGRL